MTSRAYSFGTGDNVARPGPCALTRTQPDGRLEVIRRTYADALVIREETDVGADGRADRVETFDHDGAERLVQALLDVDADGLADERVDHAYESGRAVSRTRYRTRDGRALSRTTLQYDGSGRLEREVTDDGLDGVTDGTTRYVYGATDRLEREEFLGRTGAVEERCTLSTDAAGRVVRRECSSAAGMPTRLVRFFHDAAGNLVGQVLTSPSGDVVVTADYACWSMMGGSSSSSGGSMGGSSSTGMAGSSEGTASSGAGTASSGPAPVDCSRVPEVEDATLDTPLLLPASCRAATVTGTLSSAADEDWVLLDLAAGEELRAQTSASGGGCSGLDTLLEVRAWPATAPVTRLCSGSDAATCDDDSGAGACSAVVFTASSAGTYALRVLTPGGAFPGGAYALTLALRVPGCGDGILDSMETCDDGNTTGGDGCGGSCVLEGDTCASPVVLALEAGVPLVLRNLTTVGQTHHTGVGGAATGTACSTGSGTAPDTVFEVTPPVTGIFTVRVQGGLGMDPVVGLRAGTCVASGGVLTTAPNTAFCTNAGGLGSLEQLTVTVLGGARYFLYVDGVAGSAGPYDLEAVLAPLACGNGVVEEGEQCDDRNTVNQDGCSSTCQDECRITAPTGLTWGMPLGVPPYCTRFTVSGAQIPLGGAHYYRLAVPANRQLVAETFGSAVGQCNIDTVVTFHSPTSSMPSGDDCDNISPLLVCNDDSGVERCSRATRTSSTAGDVVVRVIDYFQDQAMTYGIQLLIQ